MSGGLVVLPRIDVDNPFGAVIKTLSQDIIPFVATLTLNKDKIAQLSDAELTDYVPVLKQYAPDLLTPDAKIDWTKVNEYATSNDAFKQKVADVLSTARKFREEYAKQPIIVKLNKMDEVFTATDPNILKKYVAKNQALQKFKNVLSNADLPDEIRNNLLLNADKFLEHPEYIEVLESFLGEKKKQGTTQQNSSWRFSLDGNKQFGIKLEEPKLTPLQVSPIQMPVAEQKPVAKKGAGSGTVKPVGSKKQSKQSGSVNTQKQQNTIASFWRDGVLWEMRKGKDGKIEYVPKGEAPLVDQDPDPLTSLFGGFLISRVISKLFGKSVSKTAGEVAEKVAGKEAQEVAEKVAGKEAQEVAENIASTQAKSETKDVVGQASQYDRTLYDRTLEELRKKMELSIGKSELMKKIQRGKLKARQFSQLPEEEKRRIVSEIIYPSRNEPLRLSAEEFERIKDPYNALLKSLGIPQRKGATTVSEDVLKKIETSKQIEKRVDQIKKEWGKALQKLKELERQRDLGKQAEEKMKDIKKKWQQELAETKIKQVKEKWENALQELKELEKQKNIDKQTKERIEEIKKQWEQELKELKRLKSKKQSTKKTSKKKKSD